MRIARICRLIAVILLGAAAARAAEPKTTVREYKKVIRTYPYSDPNPVASPGRIYPYFRFDGYTDTPVDKEWTVVELENDYLKVTVLPEIGGKIWSAVEKSTGRSFIYDNHVVKFRDIAMRGPWTSGGIEANYGIMGHTPNCATPVDYLTRTDADGSASVVIGVLDLLTRTPWRLEISLPADKAYFTTRSFWYNATSLEQPYYTWMNAGIKAAGRLELVYPGTHHVGHGGEVAPWPREAASGRNLALYDQNDFGSYKSYHVVGRRTDFFGAYWHADDFGMARYSTRDDKLGKKAWIWGLSRQGMIWEQLLTDTDGQYVELQSGRLFNQAAEASTLTPFKHRGFEPHATDAWTEYWFPVKGTKGFVKANEFGALNVIQPPAGARGLQIRFSPLQRTDATLEVFDGDRVVHSTRVSLAPLQPWAATLDLAVPPARLRVRVGDRLEYRAEPGDELARPIASPDDFDWESVQGLWLKGKEWMRQRDYVQAQAALEACLKKDRHYVPALADLAHLRLRGMDSQGAFDLARRALSIDTYHPAANYYYALAAIRLGRATDALDGFEVAASDPAFRVAAWVELARLHLAHGRNRLASAYARRVQDVDRQNVEAWRLDALVARLEGRPDAARAGREAVLRLDPLDAFAGFEHYQEKRDAASREAFTGSIRNEMPHETFLELAAWYHALGRAGEAREVLELAPGQAEVLYWLAWLQRHQDPAGSQGGARNRSVELLQAADAASPRLVFPFRAESAEVFAWAASQSASWKPKYYLALILWSRNDMTRARDLLAQCGSAPDFAPFYAARAKAFEPVARDRALADLQRAARLEPRDWRYGRMMVERYLEDRAYGPAAKTAGRYYEQAPDSYILGMLYAKSLLRAGRVRDAAAVLARLRVLPYEGATEGRALYREAQLLLGAEAWKAGRVPEALRFVAAAREWPEHLGAGKPYPEDVDERLEDWLEARCHERAGRAAEASRLREQVRAASARRAAEQWPEAGASPEDARILAAWQD